MYRDTVYPKINYKLLLLIKKYIEILKYQKQGWTETTFVQSIIREVKNSSI